MAKLEPHPLMRTIVDNPDADLPRLVYADWLDEQGDPKLSMLAEFIRLDIEAETLPVRSERRKAFDQRQYELLALDRDAVRLPTADWPHESFTLRRGLPERLHCTLKRFAEGGAAVLELVPITSAAFVHVANTTRDARFAAAAFARPELIRLRNIFVAAPLEADAFESLAGNPNASNLRELDLQLNDALSSDAATALAHGAIRFTSLTKLELWGTRMTTAARATLRGAFGNRVTVNGQPA